MRASFKYSSVNLAHIYKFIDNEYTIQCQNVKRVPQQGDNH